MDDTVFQHTVAVSGNHKQTILMCLVVNMCTICLLCQKVPSVEWSVKMVTVALDCFTFHVLDYNGYCYCPSCKENNVQNSNFSL